MTLVHLIIHTLLMGLERPHQTEPSPLLSPLSLPQSLPPSISEVGINLIEKKKKNARRINKSPAK